MDLNEYSVAMLGLVPQGCETADHLVHAALGMGDEAGEVQGAIKKFAFNNKALDRGHVTEELGDVLWYMNLMVHALGITWQQVIDTNVAKLSVRYPGLVYSHERANNRSTEAEAEAMAAV